MTVDRLALPSEVEEQLGKGIALLVSVAGADLRSVACRAWGPSWDGASALLEFLLPLPFGQRTLDHLDERDTVALAMCMPTDYSAYQLKGRCVATREPVAADWQRARSHFDAFLAELPRVGLEPSVYAAWFPAHGRMVSVRPHAAFIQSPGHEAGGRL